MLAISFNTDWAYRRVNAEMGYVDQTEFTSVQLPHDAMLYEKRTRFAASGKNCGWFESADYEYVKTFVPSNQAVQELEFEGVYHNAEVWLNGEKLAFRPYGYTNFYVDLSSHLKRGESNELRVIAHNSKQPNSRWYSGAGIYRPVKLWTAPFQSHIARNGVSVRTLSIGERKDAGLTTARIQVDVRATNPGTAVIRIEELNVEKTVQLERNTRAESTQAQAQESNVAASVHIDLPSVQPWDITNPQLYTLHVAYADTEGAQDEYMTTFGVRTIALTNNGFEMNGKRVIIQGACIHHDNGVLGAATYAEAELRRVRLLKEVGYNAIRSAHNPCSQTLLEACDQLGMLVVDEYIDHWYIHKTQHDYVQYFNEWWQQDLRDMVMKDRNHPSVIMYSTGNEVSETAQKRGIELTAQMTQYLHALDAERPVTCGINIFFNFLNSIGFGYYSDEKAAKEAREAEKLKAMGSHKTVKHTASGSEFFNELTVTLGADFMKMGAALPPCDWVTKDAFAAMDVAGYNYGIKRYKHDLRKYPQRFILGSETFCSDAYAFREMAKQHPRLIGDFVWAGMDYLGETGVGSWEYADYAPMHQQCGWLTAGSGRLDLIGNPLGEALYTRVALEVDGEVGPYIAVVPVNHTHDKHSPSAWKMSNALPSWSWNGCEGQDAKVEVYARAASVELRVNGTKVGRKKLKRNCIARFTTPWHAGTVEAVSYDDKGREIGRCILRSAVADTQLSLNMEPESVHSTVKFIHVDYTDAQGTVKPLERGQLTAHVSGEGVRLLGFGSAAPYNESSFVSGCSGTYYGRALAVVEVPEGPTSNGVLTVSDDQGRSAQLQL